MAKFEVQNDEPLTAALRVRLSESEKEMLRQDADMAGLTMSELVRRRYFGKPIIAHSDRVIIKELNRIGGLIKHVHNESHGAYSEQTAALLQSLKQCIEKIAQ